MAAFDYITGNMDRKEGNILIQAKTDMLYLIDNSWAFSPIQGEALAMNQYAWALFPSWLIEFFRKKLAKKFLLFFRKDMNCRKLYMNNLTG